jgi:predicted PurR-regulated permease PerM
MIVSDLSFLRKALILFLVIAGLHFAKEFLIPICIAGILATLFLPFCNLLERWKLPRALASFFSLFTLLLIFGIIIFLLSWKISELLNDFLVLKEKGIGMVNQTQEYIFSHLGISIEKQSQIFKAEKPSISSVVQLLFGSLTSLFANIILILIYFLFLIYSRAHLKAFFIQLVKPSQKEEMEKILTRSTQVSQQYLFGLSKMIGCLWIMYGIGFSIMGVKNSIFFAILCGLLEIVPYIGNLTGTSLTLLVSALHGASLPVLVGIAITYAIVQFIQGWVLEPLILGPQVKINPLFTIIALVLGELLWGIPGIILAIPILAIFKIVCDHIEPLQPIGFLIGEIKNHQTKPILNKSENI